VSLPDEEERALAAARDLLYELADPVRTPRVPQAIRDRARAALRHLPGTATIAGLYSERAVLKSKLDHARGKIEALTEGVEYWKRAAGVTPPASPAPPAAPSPTGRASSPRRR
jgi:hypothetical protein